MICPICGALMVHSRLRGYVCVGHKAHRLTHLNEAHRERDAMQPAQVLKNFALAELKFGFRFVEDEDEGDARCRKAPRREV